MPANLLLLLHHFAFIFRFETPQALLLLSTYVNRSPASEETTED